MALGAGWNVAVFGDFHLLSTVQAAQGAGATDFAGFIQGIQLKFLESQKVQPVFIGSMAQEISKLVFYQLDIKFLTIGLNLYPRFPCIPGHG